MTFPKYKQNLRLVTNDLGIFVQSYSTLVAKIEDRIENGLHTPVLVQLGWWSVTTQKHINYAAKQLGLELVK